MTHAKRESRSLASSQRFEAAWPLRGHHIVQYICSAPSRIQIIDCEVQWLSHGRLAALRLGKYDEAQEMHRQVLKSSEKMLGKGASPDASNHEQLGVGDG